MQQNISTFCPPTLFATVESQIFRSAPIYPINFEFLKLLKLNTVVCLTEETPTRVVQAFFSQHNINFVSLS